MDRGIKSQVMYSIESIQAEDIFIKMLNEKQFNEVDVQSIRDRVDKEYN